ncbi:MAG: hypothetical protein H7Y22_06360, partial [Gemmatimonadaceae bacterium]|nr:hypothetical protein [Gloeobacterales cyanobacterium ES-bin-141]
LRIEAVVAKDAPQARGLSADVLLGQEEGFKSDSHTLRVQRTESGATFLLGPGAHTGLNPRSLADGSKDDADSQLFLDAMLAALAPTETEVRALVVTQCPLGEWLEGSMKDSIKRLLEGRRIVRVDGRAVIVDVQVLEVSCEAVPVLYYLAARRELRKGTAYKVADFGGRTLDAAYVAGNLLQATHSRHFEGGLDAARVDAVADHLSKLGLYGVSRPRIRAAIASKNNRYYHENMQVVDFNGVIEEAEEEYARQKISDLTALWRNVPADQVVINGGAVTPAIMSRLHRQYPRATVIPEDLARVANVMGLYHRAVSLHEKARISAAREAARA